MKRQACMLLYAGLLRWSGFRVLPHTVEFWFGAQYRLHERWLYEADDEAGWSKRMLYP